MFAEESHLSRGHSKKCSLIGEDMAGVILKERNSPKVPIQTGTKSSKRPSLNNYTVHLLWRIFAWHILSHFFMCMTLCCQIIESTVLFPQRQGVTPPGDKMSVTAEMCVCVCVCVDMKTVDLRLDGRPFVLLCGLVPREREREREAHTDANQRGDGPVPWIPGSRTGDRPPKRAQTISCCSRGMEAQTSQPRG